MGPFRYPLAMERSDDETTIALPARMHFFVVMDVLVMHWMYLLQGVNIMMNRMDLLQGVDVMVHRVNLLDGVNVVVHRVNVVVHWVDFVVVDRVDFLVNMVHGHMNWNWYTDRFHLFGRKTTLNRIEWSEVFFVYRLYNIFDAVDTETQKSERWKIHMLISDLFSNILI